MGTFKFELHEKVTAWKKTEFEIEADSLEKANELAIQFHINGDAQEIEWTDIEGTETPMWPSENDGESTAQIFRDDISQKVEIWDNSLDLIELK